MLVPPWSGSVRNSRTLASFRKCRIVGNGFTATVWLAALVGVAAALVSPATSFAQDAEDVPYVEPDVFHQPFNRPSDALPEAEVESIFGTYNPQVSTVFPDYRLNVGDVLEVIYHVRTGVTAEQYRLKVQDVIKVSFPFQADLDQEITVQSDGTIRLLLVGEVQVVKRGTRGINQFHFRQREADSGRWRRYDPELLDWKEAAYLLRRAADGAWFYVDTASGQETPLEEYLRAEDPAANAMPLIVDAIGVSGRYERSEYDVVRQRWRFRPIFVEQMGMTAGQLQANLSQEYSKYLRHPVLTVTVDQANIKIDELKKAITTAPRGQSRLMPVKPDGTIDLPFVGEVLAYGKTVQQLKVDVETAYEQVDLPEISVTVQMNEWAPQRIFVMGEVNRPGVLQVTTAITLMQAISAAGGTNPRAAEDIVMVVRRRGLPVPQATLVDLRSLRVQRPVAKAGDVPDFSNLRFDFFLADSDIIFVPSTVLAVTGDWVDLVFNRIVRGILPYQFVTSLNFGYELHSEPNVNKTDRSRVPPINVQLGP